MKPSAASRLNNFRPIRHFAASAVIFSHAFVLTGGWDALKQEPLVALCGISVSELAVNIFFLTSGYLVTQSLLSRGAIVAYFISRALRIYPALIVVVLLSAFVVGPIFSTIDIFEYLRTKSVYGYIAYDCTVLLPHKIRAQLPGVFDGNPYPSIVNGSLWTLPWEIWSYICLAVISVSGCLKKAPVALLYAFILLNYCMISLKIIEFGEFVQIGVRFATYFGAGIIFLFYRRLIPLNIPVLASVTAAYALSAVNFGPVVFLPLWLTYVTFFLALWPPAVMTEWSDGPDFSYGIYLYAYPVQQILVQSGFPSSPYLNAMATFILTLPLAYASWHFIEAPALHLKSRVYLITTQKGLETHGP